MVERDIIGNLEIELAIEEAYKSASEVVKVSVSSLVDIVRKKRERLYSEEEKDLKERRVREVVNAILRKFPVGTPMNKFSSVVCKAASKYQNWHTGFYKNREPSRSAFLARALIKDICLNAKMLAKDNKTLTESVKRKIRENVYKALKHHASLWKKKRRKRK